jgi:archaellum component FlaC
MGLNFSKNEPEIILKDETGPVSNYIIQIAEHTAREIIKIARPDAAALSSNYIQINDELRLLKEELHQTRGIKDELIEFKQQQQTHNKQFQATLLAITLELNEIKNGVTTANSKLDTLIHSIQNIQTILNTILADITGILTNLKSINTSLSTISSELTIILNNLSTLQVGITSLTNLVTTDLNIVISDLQQFVGSAVGQVQTAINTISTPPSDISHQLLLLMQGISSNTESSLSVSKTILASLSAAVADLQGLVVASTASTSTTNGVLTTNTPSVISNTLRISPNGVSTVSKPIATTSSIVTSNTGRFVTGSSLPIVINTGLSSNVETLSVNGKSTVGNIVVNPVTVSAVTVKSSIPSTNIILGKNNQSGYSLPGKIL